MSFTTDQSLPSMTIKRPRGALEELMRELCDGISRGIHQLPEGEMWTVARLATALHDTYPASGVRPSVGAVADNLKRWHRIGFAIINERPLAFVDFTERARSVGLSALKAEAADAQRIERSAKRAATKAAAESAVEEAVEKFHAENPTLPFDPPVAPPAPPIESLHIVYTPSA